MVNVTNHMWLTHVVCNYKIDTWKWCVIIDSNKLNKELLVITLAVGMYNIIHYAFSSYTDYTLNQQ